MALRLACVIENSARKEIFVERTALFQILKDAISAALNIPIASLQYLDEENDRITLKNDSDVEELLNLYDYVQEHVGQPLHMYVQSATRPSKPKPNLKVVINTVAEVTHKHVAEVQQLVVQQLPATLAVTSADLHILEVIGQGAFGEVRKAIHIPTSTTVAVKELTMNFEGSQQLRLINELNIMLKCQSSYIVALHGAYFEDSHMYLCMEYMDGCCLHNLCQRVGALQEAVLAHVVYSTLQGLVYLYDQFRIIHRDIKPSNVLFNSQGQFKLCDFGVSRELERSFAPTFIGTGLYMAPERITGQGATVRSDVWSLGILLIELATGRPPWEVDVEHITEFEVMQLIVDGSLPTLDSMPEPPTPSFEQFVGLCLVRNHEERQTPHQLLETSFAANALGRINIQQWMHNCCARLAQQSS